MQNTPVRSPTYLIESVDHAPRLLLLFHQQRDLRVTDVARELNVARSTAHRLLSTLAWRGFVAQDRLSKSYRAGHALFEIGLSSISELDVRRKAHAQLEGLSADLRETVNLLVLEGGGCRFIDGVESNQPVRVTIRTGTLLPAYSTAGGKALLAELSPEDVGALYLTNGLRKVTDRTITDLDELQAEFEKVRKRGYALNIDESEMGLRAVAVVIRNRSGRAIASLAVSTPTQRMGPAQLPGLVEAMVESATLISAELM